MQHKTKKIWLIALLSLLIAALFAASFTYARYYKETGVTGGKYDDTIEFVGANKYIVYTPEELVAAIENGYSYIEIAEGVEDPFVITDGVTDVSANLVLDINGHNLVRNSRNPLIDVQENVSVVIVYDSKASGSFYNPVGSLLQASGGTLTIATGNFTSGPKAEDYVKDDRTTDKGVSYSLEKYTVYYRDGYTPGATSPNRSAEYIDTGVEADLPKIVPVGIDSEAEDRYGNIYFENGIGDNDYIKDDTFLIYTEETVDASEGTTVDFEPLCDVASCDFYYYYEKSTEGSGEDKTTYAVIYGYHDVMKGAEQQITAEGFNESEDAIIDPATAVIWPYAAVRMTQGEAFIRGGTYTNQFGTAQSYGIYARGGDLAISGSSTSFSAIEDGVCVRCEKTTVDSTTYVPQLNISGTPQFFSVNNETVQVEGGDIVVSSGTAKVKADNSTGIYIEGGNLEVASTATLDVTAEITESSTGAIYHSPDGVYVGGGSLLVYGALDVKFTGLSNDAFERGDTYLTQQIKSYAVRVEAASGSDTKVTIASGSITNLVGGGVYVGGGTVTLGTSGDTTGYSEDSKTGLTVETRGIESSQNGTGEFDDNWNYHWNLTGGDAIKVVNGTLSVNGGKYTSQQGNGILVSSGTAYIYDGYFSGKDQYKYGNGFMTGPGSSYAFKLYGGNLTIFDGEFRSEGGGAFVMGTSSETKGTANIYGGIIEAKGATAVATWQYAEVLFNNEGTIAGAPDGYPTTRDLYVSGASTGITLEANTSSEFSVTVQGSGTFTGGVYSNDNANIHITENNMTPKSNRDGIWYGNGSAELVVSGGTFQGDNRSGLYFGAVPNGTNVQLSGGTFTGNSAINANNPGQITTGNILANNAWCFSRVPTSDLDTDGAICTYEYNWDASLTYKYTQVGQGNSVRLNERGLWSFAVQGNRALNEYETVVIKIGAQISFDR